MADETFEQFVSRWDAMVSEIDTAKAALKKLTDKEMPMRKAIAEAVDKATDTGLQEGVNRFEMIDGRTLKITRKIDRKIDEAVLAAVREEYSKLNDTSVAFDDILRIKYEVSKRDFDKVGTDAAKLVLSKMITTKDAAPVVEMD